MIDLTLFHELWRYTHIGIGFLGLFAFWVPVFAKKGSSLHTRAGKVFVFCGYVVAVTAMVSAAWALLSPMSFLTSRGIPEEAALREVKQTEFLFAILFFLAFSVFLGLLVGVRLIRTKQTPEQFTTTPLKSLYAGYGLTGAALFVYGLVRFYTDGVSGPYILCVVLGVLGMFDMIDMMKFFANPRPTPMAWWYKHMESMIGCGIGFHTAFLIFGLSRIINADMLPAQFFLIAIFLPTAVGIPAVSMWIRYYKRRFKELPA